MKLGHFLSKYLIIILFISSCQETAIEEIESGLQKPENAVSSEATAAVAVKYEAENAILGGNLISNKNPGYSGSGYTEFIREYRHDYVQFNVTIETAGTFELEIRYDLPGDNHFIYKSMEFLINDKVEKADFRFHGTGGPWGTWAIKKVKVKLNAGLNKITFRATGKGGPNFDYLAVSPSTADTWQW